MILNEIEEKGYLKSFITEYNLKKLSKQLATNQIGKASIFCEKIVFNFGQVHKT